MQASNDIAIVGFAYKLPQDIEDDSAFWETLEGARNLSSGWPENRMRSDAHPDPRNGRTHSCGGHFIRQDPAGFDAPLFGITPKEAASMDPIQRWTLEVSYRAFENAGIPVDRLKGSRTAVLSATWTEDYVRMAAMDPDNYDRTSATGVMASIVPNRVSYFFGMQGPSFHVDTACSSGLSAFDIACKLLGSGDADAALVTAANLLLEPGVYQMLRNLQMLSPDSTSKSFDHKANGFARGEGVLSFVLKPVSAALRDGDMIRAVVRAVASNQDGHTPSLSQPNPVAQENLIRFVYAKAGLGMAQTRYVEAHGTGTPVVILEKGVIPPNALFEKLNPAIDAEFLRVKGYTSWYRANEVSSDPVKLDASAHMLAVRRSHMRWRSFAVASALDKSQTPYGDFGNEEVSKGLSPIKPIRVASNPTLCWVFTGQGAQYVDMGWELIEAYTVFEQTLKKVDEVYKGFGSDWSIFDELRQKENINKPEYSQPLSTAVQIGLVELLRSFGITPKAVVGHSSGEIAAAYAIGALSLTSACKVSYFRGRETGKLRIANESSPGAMISINLAPDQVTDFLSRIHVEGIQGVGVACQNSPLNVTLSGPESGIDAVKEQADQEGVFAQKLKTGVAYHSSAMNSVASGYLSLMGVLEPAEILPIRMWSTVTGKPILPTELANGQYWVDNMISPVKFASAVSLMASEATNLGITDWVEVGPHPALRRYIQDTLSKDRIYYSAVLQRNHSAAQKALELAGMLFCRGHSISLTTVNNQQGKETTSTPLLVDCPSYPFDHSNKFWAEGRISKGYRLRKPTKGGELGQKAPDWNALQPRWRNFLSVETHPWIGHHVVSDMILYPAAAMLIAALEAVQETVPADKTVAGYYVKEAHFLSPVVVPENSDDRIETMISLRPVKNRSQGKEAPSNWFDISIFAYAKESHTWTEAFRATLQVDFASDAKQAERYAVDEAIRGQHREAQEACNLPVDAQVLYEDAFEHGLQYGESFRLCQDIKWDKSGARAVTKVPVPGHARYETASPVHPAVLDTMFHALRVSAGQQQAANVPLRLEDAWFTSSGWPAPGAGNLSWLASSKGRRDKGALGERGSVSALGDDDTVLARIGKLVTAAISREDSDPLAENAGARHKTLLYGIEWEPQLSLLSSAQLSEVCKADIFTHDPDTALADHLKRTAVLNLTAVRHVRNVPEEKRTKLPSTLRQHMDWMEQHVRSLPSEEREAAEAITDSEYEAQLDQFAADFPDWTLYPRVARALPEIMAGEIDPLQVIFESEHARKFYAALFQPLCGDGRLSKFINLAAHENPSLRILEVGAGTGGMTVHILNALKEREKRTGALSFTEFMYTDITPAFFEPAKERWDAEGLGDRMLYKTLDMEHPVAGQGFKENSYDLVIGGSCVHATKLLGNTLPNLRRLLKPGGKLVLLEMTKPTDISSCFFATLASGWWLSQEEARTKNKSPLVSENEWDEYLKQNGFSGNDLVLRNTREGEANIASVIVSSALEETKQEKISSPLRRVFVVDPQYEGQKNLADAISKGEDIVVPLNQLGDTSFSSSDVAVSLVEIDNPLLYQLSEEQFSRVQILLKQARNLIWVTAPQEGANDARFPHYAIAQGFLRTVRAEMPESHIVSLSIEDVTSGETRGEIINRTIETAFGDSPSAELEYVFRSGTIHTARAIESISSNNTLESLLYPRLQELTWEDSPAIKLALGTPGSLESVRFQQDERYAEILDPHNIEIEAKSWGLSRKDVLGAQGSVDDDHDGGDIGTDCSGVVTRVGQGCDAQGPQPGDRVVMLAHGCISKFPRAHETRVFKIPSESSASSFEVAAAALEPTLTAYRALIDVARVYQSDKVLVHEGASATGQMAIQIAKREGAEVFVTTRAPSPEEEEEEKRLLTGALGIDSEHIFSASQDNTSFATGIKQATNGYGVDVIVNTLAGDQLQASWELLSPGGRFVDISPGGGGSLPGAGSLARNTSYSTVDVMYLPPHVTAKLLKDIVTLLDEGKITPPTPVRVFPATEVKEAFKLLQDKDNSGRVVVVPQPSDVVPQFILNPNALQGCKLDENASYLVPGGLGGLGRSILAWMAAHGAKHLIVPSRSGATAPAAARLADSLSSSGVQLVTPKCNAGNGAELAALLEEVKQTMPPIRGVINCAMVLPNAVFANMSYDQWWSAVSAKVDVSSNLHRLLPDHENLDFFIHLSSLAGVNGQMASSNYAAGCSFQDALTRCYPGTTTLDIGWMSDVGLIAETAAYQRQLNEWDNMQRIEETELLGIIGMVCGNKRAEKEESEERTTEQQILIGVRTPADFLSKNQRPLPPVLDRPFLSTFAKHIDPTKSSRGNKNNAASGKVAAIDHGALFRVAEDDKARVSVVTSALSEKLARVTTMSVDDVDPDRTLSSYGIDSLMAIDIRNWLGREFSAKLSVFEIMSGERPIKLVAETVVRKSSVGKS
ncbi:ketoacyl-synt-domain-containing protein [Hypoxylon trugodes]|uniref:ketoacyl-synt-domain-containing protein n=1 Tax=Hypoxylon trugodes TaxID=326681 RepID=UPI002196136A|nr:ketoacyl-synt-domain-containing protein [Hypoxylon trugodes]KAI1384387.1 ketoacyl-synt-domain-containing protein [Hypoxylon trugodes]